jgi:hypothetical protein
VRTMRRTSEGLPGGGAHAMGRALRFADAPLAVAAGLVARTCTNTLYLILAALGVAFLMDPPPAAATTTTTAGAGAEGGRAGAGATTGRAVGGAAANDDADAGYNRGAPPPMGPGARGFVILMSSQTSFWPTPYSAPYAACKAYVRLLATSLWTELGAAADEGAATPIDVLGVGPAYVSGTGLFDRLPDLWFLRALAAVGQRPADVIAAAFNSVGRMPYRDSGAFTFVSAAAAWLLGSTGVAGVMRAACRWLPDYRRLRAG